MTQPIEDADQRPRAWDRCARIDPGPLDHDRDFAAGTDIYRARQLVTERLAPGGSRLPPGVPPPTMTPLTSSTSTVLVIGLTSRRGRCWSCARWPTGRCASACSPRPASPRSPCSAATSARCRSRSAPTAVALQPIGGGRAGRGAQGHRHPRRRLRRDRQPAHRLAVRGPVDRPGRHRAHGGDERQRLERSAKDVADVARCARTANRRGHHHGQAGRRAARVRPARRQHHRRDRRARAGAGELRPSIEKEGVELRADLFRPADFIAIATRNVQQSLLLGGMLVVVVLFVFLYDLAHRR